MDIKGKCALITGSSRGIGKATLEKVEGFASEKGLHVLDAVGRADVGVVCESLGQDGSRKCIVSAAV